MRESIHVYEEEKMGKRDAKNDAKEEKVKVGSNFFFSLKVGRRYVQRLTKALHETSSISSVP